MIVIRRTLLVTTLLGCALAPQLSAQQALKVPAGLPDWAFNIPDKVQPIAIRAEGVVTVPGSTKKYEAGKIAGNANPPDWFPEEHLPAPKAVAGGQGVRFACGSCHLMSGQSHSVTARIARMPAAHLMRA